MIQIFGTKKCKNTQKALRFFKERSIEIQFRDMSEKSPSQGELDDMITAAGSADALLDIQCSAAKDRGLAYMEYDARDELLRDWRLYRTPLIRPAKGSVCIGYDEQELKSLL